MKKEELKRARQYKEFGKNDRLQITVPLTWCVRFKLSSTELMILRYIQHMTEFGAEKCYTGSQKGLCAIVNASLPTVRKACDKLHDDGWMRKALIKRKLETGQEVVWVAYQARISYKISPNDPGIESLLKTELIQRKAYGYKKPNYGE